MENQSELFDELMKQREKLVQAMPALAAAQDAMRDEGYKDGALSRKVKRLMALGIALAVGCTSCILAQTKRAIEAGATKDEVMETIGVTLVMRGTTGTAESLRVVKLLDELGTQ